MATTERDQMEENGGQDRRQQILDAALKVFSRKGFEKATNKDIAQEAGGISPGLIYWYFKDKQDLLMSLVQQRVTMLSLTNQPEAFMALAPREALTLLARSYLDMFSVPGNAAFFRLMFSEITRFPQFGDLFYRVLASRLFRLLTGYLERQIELGTLRPHDTSIGARDFIGMIMIHIMARELLHQPEALATPDERIIETTVDLFLRGMQA